VREEPAVPETNDVNQRWAFIDLLLSTAFLLIVIASVRFDELQSLQERAQEPVEE
jgi:hypothetical protein